jgi:hypothetical protein
MTPEERADYERKARQLYDQIQQVHQTVNLYAAAFAMGDLLASIPPPGATSWERTKIEVAPGLLRQIGIDLCVTGHAEAAVKMDGDTPRLQPGTGCQFSYHTDPNGHLPGILSSVVTNFEPIMRMRQSPRIALETLPLQAGIMSIMFPWEMLATDTAQKLTPSQVENHLQPYRATVNSIRWSVAARLSNVLRAPHFTNVDWDPEKIGGALAYLAFRTEGIELP